MPLPPELIQSLEHISGFNRDNFIKVHESGEQVVSVRRNPSKNFDTPGSLFAAPLSPVPWSTNGFYLNQRPSFTADPLFHAGAYYVQEASSMFLEQALQQTVDVSRPLKVLDLCAAPGGKSTLLQSLLNEQTVLISNEVIKTRVTILSENITKWGAANVIVTNNDPKDFQRLENYFDVIVVDAPCSGSGLFRKDAGAITEWSENNVALCSQRQQRILADVFPALKEDGVLIYSTCSYSKEEDEEICDWIMEELKVESCKLTMDSSWGIVETLSAKKGAWGYRFYPDQLKGEGFFIAAVKKTNSCGLQAGPVKNKPALLSPAATAAVKPFLKNAPGFFFIQQHEAIIALPLHLQEVLPVLQSALYIKKAGVTMGTVIRDELIPAHELALSTVISTTVPSIAVDRETALQYLRRQDIKPATVLKGWALLTYAGLPLGWVKILPNRINNYYPAAWRIVNK